MRWPRFIRRRTMLPPMRPRPTIPISIVTPLSLTLSPAGRGDSLSDCGLDCGCERFPARRGLFTERDAQHREPPRRERFEVAQRLRLPEDREAVGLARDEHVARVVLNDLEEHAGLGTALVQLAGGVKEARTVARGGRVCVASRTLARIDA